MPLYVKEDRLTFDRAHRARVAPREHAPTAIGLKTRFVHAHGLALDQPAAGQKTEEGWLNLCRSTKQLECGRRAIGRASVEHRLLEAAGRSRSSTAVSVVLSGGGGGDGIEPRSEGAR